MKNTKRPSAGFTKNKNHRIAIVSGGTGGHSFPAAALAQQLAKRGHAPAVITEQRGVDYFTDYFKKEKINCPVILLPLPRPSNAVIKKIMALIGLAAAIWPTYRWLRQYRPRLVVGFGGYMTVPTLLAARLLSIPMLLVEQNAILGRANRLFAPMARAIALGLPTCRGLTLHQQRRALWVGTPIRQDFFAPRRTPKNKKYITLMITGGSQGARSFASIMPLTMARLQQLLPVKTFALITIAQQAKKDQLQAVATAYHHMGIRAVVKDFFTDMPMRLATSDIFIGRAGASTLAEISAAAIPSILIPFPHATDNHQWHNASLLGARQAALMVVEKKSLTANNPAMHQLADDLADNIYRLLTNPAQAKTIGRNIGAMAKKNAGLDLMKLAIRTIEQHIIKI